eukprot:Hpha_TRINITY_DN15078_c7_g6::TRINITY_DN15078_c7_g6_i1::g.123670::m.123670
MNKSGVCVVCLAGLLCIAFVEDFIPRGNNGAVTQGGNNAHPLDSSPVPSRERVGEVTGVAGVASVSSLILPEVLRGVGRGGGGGVTLFGCDALHGFNNQRQALHVLLLVGVLVQRPVVLPHYVLNTHDNATLLRFGDLYDLPLLRAALSPVEVLTAEDPRAVMMMEDASVVPAPDGMHPL